MARWWRHSHESRHCSTCFSRLSNPAVRYNRCSSRWAAFSVCGWSRPDEMIDLDKAPQIAITLVCANSAFGRWQGDILYPTRHSEMDRNLESWCADYRSEQPLFIDPLSNPRMHRQEQTGNWLGLGSGSSTSHSSAISTALLTPLLSHTAKPVENPFKNSVFQPNWFLWLQCSGEKTAGWTAAKTARWEIRFIRWFFRLADCSSGTYGPVAGSVPAQRLKMNFNQNYGSSWGWSGASRIK